MSKSPKNVEKLDLLFIFLIMCYAAMNIYIYNIFLTIRLSRTDYQLFIDNIYLEKLSKHNYTLSTWICSKIFNGYKIYQIVDEKEMKIYVDQNLNEGYLQCDIFGGSRVDNRFFESLRKYIIAYS